MQEIGFPKPLGVDVIEQSFAGGVGGSKPHVLGLLAIRDAQVAQIA